MNTLLMNNVLFYNLTLCECLFYFVNGFLVLFVLLGSAAFYTFCRPLFPARVNCWFCNKNSLVPYNTRNCFDCRFCDQYNGFTSDGDYNTDVVQRNNKDYAKYATNTTAKENGLCTICNVNQQLKIQQLASFTPMNDSNFDAEIEHFKCQLEKAYRLCEKCSLVLTQTLQTQHYDLLTQRLNKQCPTVKLEESGGRSQVNLPGALAFASVTSLIVLLILSTSFWLKDILSTFAFFERCLTSMDYLWAVSVIGVASCVVSLLLKRNLSYRDFVQLSLWGIMQALTLAMQPTYVFLPAVTAIICKFLPEKASIKRIPIPISNGSMQSPRLAKPIDVLANNSLSKLNAVNNIKSPVIQESPKKDKATTGDEKCKVTPRRIETRSQSIKKMDKTKEKVTTASTQKTAKKTPDADKKRERMFSPPPEVYQGLGSLRLGSPEPLPRPKSDKPSNYLFEKLNFNNSNAKKSIIRPSRFNVAPPVAEKNSSLASVPPQISEICFPPNSSTPSQADAYPVLEVSTLSPYSHCNGKYPPTPYTTDFDFPYNTNMGYDPIGHTTVYTYTRPAPYPYGFPQRFSPPYDYSFSPKSPDSFSHSKTHSFSSFSTTQESRSWHWVKQALYIGSACLNVLTLLFLAYSVWKS